VFIISTTLDEVGHVDFTTDKAGMVEAILKDFPIGTAEGFTIANIETTTKIPHYGNLTFLIAIGRDFYFTLLWEEHCVLQLLFCEEFLCIFLNGQQEFCLVFGVDFYSQYLKALLVTCPKSDTTAAEGDKHKLHIFKEDGEEGLQ